MEPSKDFTGHLIRSWGSLFRRTSEIGMSACRSRWWPTVPPSTAVQGLPLVAYSWDAKAAFQSIWLWDYQWVKWMGKSQSMSTWRDNNSRKRPSSSSKSTWVATPSDGNQPTMRRWESRLTPLVKPCGNTTRASIQRSRQSGKDAISDLTELHMYFLQLTTWFNARPNPNRL